MLVVDDDTSVASALGRNLRAAGHQVTVVTSAREAEAVVASGFDVVVADVVMPEVSGVELQARN